MLYCNAPGAPLCRGAAVGSAAEDGVSDVGMVVDGDGPAGLVGASRSFRDHGIPFENRISDRVETGVVWPVEHLEPSTALAVPP